MTMNPAPREVVDLCLYVGVDVFDQVQKALEYVVESSTSLSLDSAEDREELLLRLAVSLGAVVDEYPFPRGSVVLVDQKYGMVLDRRGDDALVGTVAGKIWYDISKLEHGTDVEAVELCKKWYR